MRNEIDSIVYRGKSLEDGKWYRGCLLKRKVRNRHIFYIVTERAMAFACISHIGNASIGLVQVDPDTVCISIGSYDCDNKEIFTDDIVRDDEGQLYIVRIDTSSDYGESVFGVSKYHGTYTDPEIEIISLKRCIIVGNLHDKGEW